jgi:hypothetical protein
MNPLEADVSAARLDRLKAPLIRPLQLHLEPDASIIQDVFSTIGRWTVATLKAERSFTTLLGIASRVAELSTPSTDNIRSQIANAVGDDEKILPIVDRILGFGTAAHLAHVRPALAAYAHINRAMAEITGRDLAGLTPDSFRAFSAHERYRIHQLSKECAPTLQAALPNCEHGMSLLNQTISSVVSLANEDLQIRDHLPSLPAELQTFYNLGRLAALSGLEDGKGFSKLRDVERSEKMNCATEITDADFNATIAAITTAEARIAKFRTIALEVAASQSPSEAAPRHIQERGDPAGANPAHCEPEDGVIDPLESPRLETGSCGKSEEETGGTVEAGIQAPPPSLADTSAHQAGPNHTDQRIAIAAGLKTDSVVARPRLDDDLTFDRDRFEMFAHVTVEVLVPNKELCESYKTLMSRFIRNYEPVFSSLREEIYRFRTEASPSIEDQRFRLECIANELIVSARASDLIALAVPEFREIDEDFPTLFDQSDFETKFNKMRAAFGAAVLREIQKMPSTDDTSHRVDSIYA